MTLPFWLPPRLTPVPIRLSTVSISPLVTELPSPSVKQWYPLLTQTTVSSSFPKTCPFLSACPFTLFCPPSLTLPHLTHPYPTPWGKSLYLLDFTTLDFNRVESENLPYGSVNDGKQPPHPGTNQRENSTKFDWPIGLRHKGINWMKDGSTIVYPGRVRSFRRAKNFNLRI